MSDADMTPLVPLDVCPPPPSRASSRPSPVLEWGDWKAPPRRRNNRTSEARIAQGGHKIHLTIDLGDDGRPCAIKAHVHKEGAVFRGMLDAISDLASQTLQHGAAIQEVAMRMRFVRFEPSGAVEGHGTIKGCTSLIDLLGQMLLAEFPADEVLLEAQSNDARLAAQMLASAKEGTSQ